MLITTIPACADVAFATEEENTPTETTENYQPEEENVEEENVEEEVVEEEKETTPKEEPEEKKTTTKKTPKPTIKLKAKADGKLNIVLTWNKVKGAKKYRIYKYSKKKGKYVAYYTVKASKRKFKYTKGGFKKTYKFKVAAIGAGGKVLCKSKRVRCYNKLEYKKKFARKFKCYAYCQKGYTASGRKTGYGIIAVDPKVIPLGTKLYVEGYGFCIASDIGGNIKGRTIDVWLPTNYKCCLWGVRYKRVYIL